MNRKFFTKKNISKAVISTALTIKLIKTFELTNKNIIDDVFSVFASAAIGLSSTEFIFSLFGNKDGDSTNENVEEE